MQATLDPVAVIPDGICCLAKHANVGQGPMKQAEAQERAGAYAEAAASYRVLLQGNALADDDDKLLVQAKMAWCLLQTGQAKAVSYLICCGQYGI